MVCTCIAPYGTELNCIAVDVLRGSFVAAGMSAAQCRQHTSLSSTTTACALRRHRGLHEYQQKFNSKLLFPYSLLVLCSS